MKNKFKIKKSLKRRIKITAGGKILHRSNFIGHLRRNKTKKQIRRLKQLKSFTNKRINKIKKALGVA